MNDFFVKTEAEGKNIDLTEWVEFILSLLNKEK